VSNCYWVEEDGVYELCVDPNLPPLPGDFVVWDETPQTLSGRTIAATYPRGSSWVEVVANPDTIVIGCNSWWGTTNTYKSYIVCTSTDHGFTWQGYDKYPHVDGVNVGYMAAGGVDVQWTQFFGTAITYDEEGGEFFSVDCTMDDVDDDTAKVRTSKSTDGVNWTSLVVTDINYTAIICDAYNGTLWYIGYNYTPYWAGVPAYEDYRQIGLRASTDDGATWTGQKVGGPSYDAWGNVYKESVRCSANAAGLHVINNAWDGNDTNMYYIRPTSNTTWAAPVLMYADTSSMAAIRIGADDFCIASRARPGEIYIGTVDETASYSVTYRKSVDNGLNWTTAAIAWSESVGGDLGNSYANPATYNVIRVVELDDGRLVIVLRLSPGGRRYAYAVNSDGLTTGFGPTTILQPEFNLDATQYANFTPRFEVTAKGNDVVIVWCNDSPGSGDDFERSLVFRP
jgi:hypothetical protein